MITLEQFGENLQTIRKRQLNVTQKEAAEQSKVGQGTFSQWENGSLNPSLLNVVQFCEAFDLSLDDLVGLKKNSNR